MKLTKKSKSLITLIVMIILIITIFVCKDNIFTKRNTKMKLGFESRVEKLKNFDSGKYYKIGWLQVQGTNMDLPILDFSSYESEIDYSYGWLSSGYRTGENREVILGHNILNVSATPMLPNENLSDFEELMAFVYYDFAKENLYVQYTKDNKDELYLIYAIGFNNYGSDKAGSMKDKNDIKEYIERVRKNSIYDYDIDVNSNDTLLQIKTCTRMFGNEEKQEFVLELRKVRDNEKTYKYSVEINDNFEKLKLNEENM